MDPAAITPQSFDLLSIFLNSDWVVKLVMIGLAGASLWSWTIILEKLFRFSALNRETDKFVESGLGVLAIVATASPFVGLFGTVWGIMGSFQAIAIQKNTSLAIVAPSIAEALFATAIGLVAAIPAYIAYNAFSTAAGKYSARLEGFADDLSTAIQRRLAERG